jgi:hypothetical protein
MRLSVARTRVLAATGLSLAAVIGGGCTLHSSRRSTPPTTGSHPARTTTTGASQPAAAVQVSHDRLGDHAEPAVAANPADPNNLLAASMVVQGTGRGLATYASFDGGRTWQSNGLLPGAGMRYDADVAVTFDSSGHGFVSGWVGDRASEDQGGAWVWRTDDGGRTFDAAVRAVPGFCDHPGLAADPTGGSEDLYLAGTFTSGGGLRFTRSTDGGKTFEPTRPIDASNGAQGRLPVVGAGPDGLVAVMYYVFQPDGTPVATVVTSTDHGRTFGRPTPLAPVHPPPSPAVQARSGPSLAVDPRTGELYAAVTTMTSRGSEIDAYTSHDQGGSWVPTTVAQSASVTYAQSQLAVDNAGRVGVFAFAISGGAVQPLVFVSPSGSATFGPARPLTDSPFVPQTANSAGDADGSRAPDGPAWIGDYQAMATTPGVFHPVWNGSVTGSLELMTLTVR